MLAIKKGFFAYSSRPQIISETIEDAISKLNESGLYSIKSWKELKINGHYIINQVVHEIESSDFFCADLTGLNDNVLFEIGYAIGRNKPIILFNDTTQIESFRRYKELDLFTTIGYSAYTNSQNIIDTLFSESIEEKPGSLDALAISNPIEERATPLLFLKNQVYTNFSTIILKSINDSKLEYILDDATENKVQPFSWYIQKLTSCQALLTEFSTSTRSGHEVHNSKCSLVAGVALGLGLNVLLISEEPYETPLDYKELLKKYTNRSECLSSISPFLDSVKTDYFRILEKSRNIVRTQINKSELQKISFGEFLAEHEKDQISNYYVETTAYRDLIRNEYNIIVGRKGSGKSATLYYLKNSLELNAIYHICIIRPFNFDLDGLLYTLINVPEHFQKSYLIESVWKLIIYTEIAKSIYEKLISRNIATLTPEEISLIEFVERDTRLFATEFHDRIHETFKLIANNLNVDSNTDKHKISELLHIEDLPKVKELILNALGKGKQIVLLVDNLDKSWKKGELLKYQSKWILGLLGLTGKLIKELSSSKIQPKEIKFQITIFLRSDIFNNILIHAREPDKIQYSKLRVEDKDILFRIIEERFIKLSNNKYVNTDLWEKYMPVHIDGEQIQDFIYRTIIPRPRDIIFLFNKMKEVAILRGHEKIEVRDVRTAYEEYSEWILSSFLVENGVTLNQMEDFLYQFVGEKRIVSKTDIENKAMKSKIYFTDKYSVDDFINNLTLLSILGRETRLDQFTYSYEMENDKKSKMLAEKLNTDRFQIHRALIPALELIE
ncbi:P-loop ATPase, Sll1717 family [Leptospira noguchii]|uniref:P-loop ATPase, Sll1717 family n=1 Tax=Leptospira noguchii TaxID=28182 RepID=UPI0003286578|nr:hypothetical protein [Leptospira noguchii]EMS84712.1 hypothetical protein LEP1GSC073_1770 [Leptospira noguchii str. Cascata]